MLELSDEPAGPQPTASGLQPLMERLYFDYNATTPLLPEVLEPCCRT